MMRPKTKAIIQLRIISLADRHRAIVGSFDVKVARKKGEQRCVKPVLLERISLGLDRY